MTNRPARAALVALLVTAPAAGVTAQAPPSLSTSLEACFDAQASVVPFLGLAHARRGAERFDRTEGRVDGSDAPGADTQYQLASVGKVFTQVAIGQLIDRGRVGFDAPVGSYLRDLPPQIGAVTIEQLLHHRSGVAPNTLIDPERAAVMERARTARELLPLIVDKPLAFAPGTQSQYSNGGYFLLGAVIEAVSGLSYDEYLRREIFDPLRMSATGMVAGEGAAPPMSRFAGPGQPPLEVPRAIRGGRRGTPAGGGFSTASDLARLGEALLSNRLLSDVTKARLFVRRDETWRIGQAGGSPGANTFFAAYPDTGSILILLTNHDPPAAELMARALEGVLAGRGCETQTAPQRQLFPAARRPG